MAYLRQDMTIETAPVRPVSVGARQQNAVALEAFSEGINYQAWMDEAECAGSGVDFFPERGEPTESIKALCRACPVRSDCLEYGLMQKYGIWGGTSERQRRLIRRERGMLVDGLVRQPMPCAVCGAEFTPTSNGAKLCSDVCRATSERVAQRERQRLWRLRKIEAS